MSRIYLDHAATTPVRPEAVAAMLPHLSAGARNASSLHAEGRAARAVLDAARATVARVLGATPREIVFTSGASESIHLALTGVARGRHADGRHIVTSAIEHQAVLATVDGLESEGCSVTRLAVDVAGRLDPATFAGALRAGTVLASIMLANNELGTVNPVAELARVARRAGVVFHTDAVQAPGALDLDVQRLGVDLLSLSGHKFGAPSGIGVLYVRRGTPLAARIVGGGQEHGLRAGTENIVGIVGLAAALELAQAEREQSVARIGALRERLEAGILATVPDACVNARDAVRLPGIASIAFGAAAAEALLVRLDLEGVAASAGSACAAGSLEPSHVIAALQLPPASAGGVIRFSLGRTTTRDEIERVIALLPQLVREVRGTTAPV